MPRQPKEITEESERRRLNRIFKNLPKNEYAVAQGLIIQAARLRVRLNKLWAEIEAKGETEKFSQSPNQEPYERERPCSRTFTATDKAYQSIIKQLTDLCPPSDKKESKMASLLKAINED